MIIVLVRLRLMWVRRKGLVRADHPVGSFLVLQSFAASVSPRMAVRNAGEYASGVCGTQFMMLTAALRSEISASI